MHPSKKKTYVPFAKYFILSTFDILLYNTFLSTIPTSLSTDLVGFGWTELSTIMCSTLESPLPFK